MAVVTLADHGTCPMRCLAVALLAMLSVSSTARAEDDCEGETRHEMNMCAGRKFEKSDKVMNERYSKLMKRLDLEDQEKLRKELGSPTGTRCVNLRRMVSDPFVQRSLLDV
jgi:uncharacterized protein